MIKRLLILQLLLTLFVVNVSAYHFEEDGVYYVYDYWGGPVSDVLVVNNPEDPYVGKVSIPAKVTHFDEVYKENVTYNVTGISYGAFQNCEHLTSVTLSEGLSFIRSAAFQGCTALKNVVIPNSVEVLEAEVFEGCTNLEAVSLPGSLKAMGYNCFGNCVKLASIMLPGSLGEFNATYAFSSCSALKNVSLGEGITMLPSNCFSNCVSLEQIDLPRGLAKIGDNSLSGCENLRVVTAVTPPTHIGVGAFCENKNLEVLPVLTEVEELGYGAFINCVKLVSLKFSDKLQTVSAGNNIGMGPCAGCESLVEVDLGNSVKCLPRQSFYGCKSLKNFRVPDNCTVIGPGAFHFCTSLEAISMPRRMESIGAYDDMATGEVFRECTSLKSLRIPEGVKVLENSNIVRCTSLTELKLPSTLERIENWGIRGCPLAKLHLPNSLVYIGSMAIDLDNLQELIIPANVVEFGTEGYWLQSENLKKLVFSPGKEKGADIGTIFVSNLEDLYIGRDFGYPEDFVSNKYLGLHWKTLRKLTIGDSVTDIRYLSPFECDNLESIVCSALTPPLVKEFTSAAYENISPVIDVLAYEAYSNAPVWCNFKNFELVGGLNSVGDIYSEKEIDYSEPYEIFTLDGIRKPAGPENLGKGIYIIRQGNVVRRMIKK